MRSPKHLIVSAVGALAVVTGIGVLVPNVIAEDTSDDGAAQRAADRQYGDYGGTVTEPEAGASATPRQQPSRLTEPRSTPQSAEPDPDALATASAWAEAWVEGDDDMSNEEWLAGVEPYTTEEYAPVMESIDPARIPADEVTGEPEVVSSHTNSVEVDVPTDGPTVRLSVIDTAAGWLVAQYDEAG